MGKENPVFPLLHSQERTLERGLWLSLSSAAQPMELPSCCRHQEGINHDQKVSSSKYPLKCTPGFQEHTGAKRGSGWSHPTSLLTPRHSNLSTAPNPSPGGAIGRSRDAPVLGGPFERCPHQHTRLEREPIPKRSLEGLGQPGQHVPARCCCCAGGEGARAGVTSDA